MDEIIILKRAIEKFSPYLEEDKDFFTDLNKDGDTIVNPRLTALLKLFDNATSILERMIKVEEKAKQNLTVRDVLAVIQQVNHHMSETCGICPVRKEIARRISEQIKVSKT